MLLKSLHEKLGGKLSWLALIVCLAPALALALVTAPVAQAQDAPDAEDVAQEAEEKSDKKRDKAAEKKAAEEEADAVRKAALEKLEGQVLARTMMQGKEVAEPDDVLHLDLSTGGRVSIRLFPEAAPGHVERIKTLVRQGFYDGIVFHRVIEGFMAQTGDPTGTGSGGSDLPDLQAEFNYIPHVRGTVSMARLGNDENSANSQFFIVFYPRYSLDNNYTNFGRVIAGMGYVDAINRGEPPAEPSRIVQASLGSQNKPIPDLTAQPQGEEPAVTLDDLNTPIS